MRHLGTGPVIPITLDIQVTTRACRILGLTCGCSKLANIEERPACN